MGQRWNGVTFVLLDKIRKKERNVGNWGVH